MCNCYNHWSKLKHKSFQIIFKTPPNIFKSSIKNNPFPIHNPPCPNEENSMIVSMQPHNTPSSDHHSFRKAHAAATKEKLQAKAASTITKYWKLRFKYTTLPRLTNSYVKLNLIR